MDGLISLFELGEVCYYFDDLEIFDCFYCFDGELFVLVCIVMLGCYCMIEIVFDVLGLILWYVVMMWIEKLDLDFYCVELWFGLFDVIYNGCGLCMFVLGVIEMVMLWICVVLFVG